MKRDNKADENIKDILKFKIINKLKSVYRLNSVDKRHESSAEHSWSCLILADYFLDKYKIKLDRLKVYELLTYHDIVEIYAGDFPLSPELEHVQRKKMQESTELSSANRLKKELPESISNRYYDLFLEFQNEKTIEARFARCIDVFDSQIHEIDYKTDWKGWTKEFLINKKGKYFEEFPDMKKEFYALLDFLEEEGYFSQ